MEEAEDAIAVVGIGCNFPGGEGLDNFWKVLLEGKNCSVPIPKERFDISSWYDPDDNKAGKSRTAKAALINGFNEFDHRFFGISDSEVEQMDPQQKQLLQCVYRALENAGIPMEKASGTRTGVYFGIMNRDYETNAAHVHPSVINHWTGTGLAMSIAANRVSYIFNFTGPSLSLDCACSSSLVALHLACQSIKQGDCEMAVCGGVNCIIEPRVFVALSKAKMISPEGTSKPFSNKADGYGRGEGCGVVLLKPLKKAIQDHDYIWGIISKTAVNQDGHSVSPITKPSMTQQEELLRRIYSESDLVNVQYIEAHGTGTPVGDPTEAGSISNVIAKAKPPGSEILRIGSVKSNIGHTESAAGVAGLIKVLLMMKHETICPSVFYSEETASVDAKALNIKVPKESEKWKALGPRIAGVNNFGFGGTNAHAIVKQHKQSHIEQRNDPRLVFVFCGNGVTYHGMCKQLLKHEPVFRGKMEEIGKLFQRLSKTNILDTLESEIEGSDFNKPHVIQPVLFAIQVGITTLLRYWGVKPDAILGHSVGEVAAAHCSGLLSLEDAVKVIYFRSTLQNRVTGGKMLVISNMAISKVTALLPCYSGKVCLAAFNSLQSCTLSGDADAIESIHKELSTSANSQNLFLRVLDVPAAYHSHMMDPILQEIEETIGSLKVNDLDTELFSTVTGKEVQHGDFCTGEYWARNIREPVAFEQAVNSATKGKKNVVFVEIGPRRALQRNIMESLGNDTSVLASVQPEKDHETLLSVVSNLFELGVQVNWDTFYRGYETMPLPIPKYQFDCSDRDVIIGAAQKNTVSNHPVLFQTGSESNIFSCDLISDSSFYLKEHKHNNIPIIPGAFYAELGLAAFMASAKPKVPLCSLQVSVIFHSPFVLSQNSPEMKVQLEKREENTKFMVLSPSAMYASGTVVSKKERLIEEQCISLSSIYKRCKSVVSSKEFYGYLSQGGFQYGDIFKNKWDVHYGEDLKEAFANVTVPEELRSQLHDYYIHPVVLDFLMQLLPVTVEHIFTGRPGFPAKIGSLTVFEPLKDEMVVYLRAIDEGKDHFEICGCFADKQGKVLVEVKHVIIKYLGSRSHVVEEYFYHNTFSVIPEGVTSASPPKALVFADMDHISPDFALAGMTRSIAAEIPELSFQLIDISSTSPKDIAALSEVLRSHPCSKYPELVVKDGQILKPSIVRTPPEIMDSSVGSYTSTVSEPCILQTDEAHNMTHLSAIHCKGDPDAVRDRSKPTPDVEQEIHNVEKQWGNCITSMECDISVSECVHKVINAIGKTYPGCPIKGVFHSAVVLDDGLIESLNRSLYEKVLKPKVNGALNLHHATKHCQLDYFVCYSSISAFLGNASQTNYAAANTFLDMFCQYRRKIGLPGQSINWGALNLGLLLNKEHVQRFLEAKGMMVLDVAEIHQSLEQCLVLNLPQQAVCRFHFRNIRFNILSQNAALTMRLSALVVEAIQKSKETDSQTKQTQTVSPKDYVVSLICETIGMDKSELKDESPLSSVGIDSMQAMTLQNLIFQERGVNVPLVKLLDPNATLSTVVSLLSEGEGEGLDNFWKVLLEGKNCSVPIPKERFDKSSWYDPDDNKAGKSRTAKAALINGFNEFDHRFFGISDSEVEQMDPQQKQLLQCVYRALENAGIPMEKASGTRTGVYFGIMNRDYETNAAHVHPSVINHWTGTCLAMSIAANRVSYIFNFTGPSLSLDCACSSSLVALHLACQSIKQGDCEMAVCGGVNCIIEPRVFVALSKAKMISPEGTSKPFSNKADGYGRGEGCGVVLLKPLKKAIQDHDHIWGIISKTAVNQDGHSVSPITKPSMTQQEELLRRIYSESDLVNVQYIEAHGTGTPVGDQTEAGSISNVIAKAKPPGSEILRIGSVKSNIGHTESAAGVAGLIKVLLMMKHETICPSVFYSEETASVDAKALNIKVPKESEKWEALGPRIAGVNNFGFGGTNAHAIVKQHKQSHIEQRNGGKQKKYWGVKPDAILGHSVGEVAAAHCSGLLSLEDAVKVIYFRSTLQNRVTGGKMLVISNMAISEVTALLPCYSGKVCLAAFNSLQSCTLSGDADAIESIHKELSTSANSQNLFLRVLDVPAAYHSHMMDPILQEIEETIGSLKVNDLDTELFSTVTGKEVQHGDFCTGEYWARNIREPVAFEQAVNSATKGKKNVVFVEIGPRRALQRNIMESLGNDTSVLASVQPEKDHETLLSVVSNLFELGVQVNWDTFYRGYETMPLPIPKYQFDCSDRDVIIGAAQKNTVSNHPVLLSDRE
ncbi:hypothetical protein JOQ06_018197 [Pogonophryne albipinna]|uniref:Carrier domain-containing protein n=2 Tax=Pogonophryne albipinna TaxID=1090488 RepID=A0AAD6F9A5_9TELE|nr:hypothetical protein JOQ06_018197 [Pogonophryne albipinna]